MSETIQPQESDTAVVETPNKARSADTAVRTHAVGSAVIGAIPIGPVVMVALLALNLKMLHKISKIYGVDFSKDLGKEAIFSFVGACGAGAIGGRVIWGLSTLIPVAGPLIQTVTVPVFAASFTYGIGQIFTQHFASGGTFLDFDPDAVRDHFYAEFEKGKDAAAQGNMAVGAAQPVSA